MAVHEEILQAAIRICRRRRGWTFRPVEIVRALPHLDAGTVRTHIVSRLCVNAPKNHPHRWDYFERVSRATYEIRRPYRRARVSSESRVAETPATYGVRTDLPRRDTIHAVVTESDEWYVAECLEIAVVTQGRTLDEVVTNLEAAVDLHLDGEDHAALGLAASPRIAVTYELPRPRA